MWLHVFGKRTNNGRRRHIVVLCFLTVIISCTCGIKTNEKAVYVDAQSSFFSDYIIEDEQVLIFCHLTIVNSEDIPIHVTIQGDFSEDVDGGLLCERFLTAQTEKDTGDTAFILSPGKNVFDVIFLGKNGDSTMKQNRNLPHVIITRID